MQQFQTGPITREPLHSQVAERLRELISHGELAPGDRLNERILCEQFGISRTPLREAIKILSLEGLVQLLPNRGAVVTELTRDEAEDMFQVMAAMEALGGELACRRATDWDVAEIRSLHEEMAEYYAQGNRPEYFRVNQRIHERIIECARNEELTAIYRQLARRIQRGRYMANFSQERWAQAVREHEEMLNALSRRDSERLKAILKGHLENKFAAIQAWLANDEKGETAASTVWTSPDIAAELVPNTDK